ncbi:MAG: hypothetical protein J6Z79_01675 [Clostridia bacterium]|nr:hypothetical protein [Clostridia bacterium]
MKANYDALVNELVAGLGKLPEGTEITLCRLMTFRGIDPKPYEKNGDLFDVCEVFRKAARKAGFKLDNSRYRNLIIGLPWNIPFTARKKG